jgi:CheY-like chemotaxis protein
VAVIVSITPKHLILCIDDDGDNLRIRELLLQQLGYETLCARDGASGLRLFTTVEVSIVIIDNEMPGRSGSFVAHKMRQLKPDVPILLLSGLPIRPDDLDGQVDAFFGKGGWPSELLQKVEDLLSRKAPRQDAPTAEAA